MSKGKKGTGRHRDRPCRCGRLVGGIPAVCPMHGTWGFIDAAGVIRWYARGRGSGAGDIQYIPSASRRQPAEVGSLHQLQD